MPNLQPDPNQTTEQTFRNGFYDLQPALNAVNEAMGDARRLCYLILDRVPDTDENELVRDYATRWLDENGRSALAEARLAERDQ